MDTFDTITLSAFLLLQLPLAARLTFWKRDGQLLNLRVILCPMLLEAIALLSLSANHHWNAPHRGVYQFLLVMSGLVISVWQLVMNLQRRRQEARLKKAKGSYRR